MNHETAMQKLGERGIVTEIANENSGTIRICVSKAERVVCLEGTKRDLLIIELESITRCMMLDKKKKK